MKSSILGLDIYELSDVIIFMTVTNILEKKKFRKRARFPFFLKTRARLGPFVTQQGLIYICLANPS